MASAKPDYYFTLFKKFQVPGHLPEGSDHGAPGGEFGFDVNDPNSAFGSSNSGVLLGATPVNSPQMGMLNAKRDRSARRDDWRNCVARHAMVRQPVVDRLSGQYTAERFVDFLPTASIGGNPNEIWDEGKMITKEDLC